MEEVEKAAERRLRLLKDMAEDEKIVLSPIPVFSGNELFVPYVVYSYNPFSPSEERNIEESDVRVRRKAWFSFLQASRNSIDPFNSSEAFDFHSKYVFYEMERQWQYLVRNYSLAFGYSPLEEKEEDLKIQIIFSHNLAFPNPINLYLQAEMGMGNFFVHAFPTIPSLHEILSLCSLERALNLAVVNENLEKCPVEFHPLTALLELKSFAFDEDPRVYFIDKKFVEEHGSYFSDYLANASIIKRIEKKLIEKLKKDGYCIETTVSAYWPKLMKRIEKYFEGMKFSETIKNDLGRKNGTNALKELSAFKPYEEIIHYSWENLCRNRRWIR